MTKTPNNFPRERDHSPVTADHLKTLEKNRATPQQGLNYTIGGAAEKTVHTTLEAERNYALTSGHKRLRAVSDKLQTDQVFAANEGRAKAEMGKAANSQKAYIDMQKAKAKEAQKHVPDHTPAHDR